VKIGKDKDKEFVKQHNRVAGNNIIGSDAGYAQNSHNQQDESGSSSCSSGTMNQSFSSGNGIGQINSKQNNSQNSQVETMV
jgi:hypothetical protein